MYLSWLTIHPAPTSTPAAPVHGRAHAVGFLPEWGAGSIVGADYDVLRCITMFTETPKRTTSPMHGGILVDGLVGVKYAHPMGRKHTDEQVQRRVDVIEECLTRGDWTLRRQAQVANQFDVTTSMVRKDAARIRREWASQEQGQTREEMRSDWRARVHKAIRDASESGHTHTVARLLSTEARVLGLEAPTQVEVAHTVRHTVEDAPRLAAEVFKALPLACQVLGVDMPALPALPVIDVEVSE